MPLPAPQSRSHRSLVAFAIVSLSVLVLFAPRLMAQSSERDRQLVQEQNKQTARTQRRVALVIGNGDYQNASRLANPTNDAADMATALSELGFQLVGGRAHLNQTADQMKQLIVQFGERIGVGVGLFYYAGHGVQSQGHNYLIPIEAKILREKTLEFDAVDVNRVLAELDAAGNGFNIVILDACRNSPFGRSWRSADQGLAQVNAPEGTLIAYATSPGRVANDGAGRNGTYTGELLRQMRVPGITIEETFKTVRAAVKTASQNQQTPWESSSLVGKFCFAGSCDGADQLLGGVKSGSATPSMDVSAFELSYWDSIKSSTNADDFKAYLEKYPNGQFAALARNRISTLSKEASSSESTQPSSADPIELAFWDSIRDSTDPEDFKSYLKKYPNGQFVELARRRAASKASQETLTGGSESSPTFFHINTRVRPDNMTNGWTNTGLVVRRGQRLRITASGRMSLGNNRFATPDGLPNIPDRDKLMRNQPTGGLIAVIGDDNDDFIFVGHARDFVAQRDGVLFLGVNEGNLSDNSGLFEVVIEAEAANPR